MKISVNSTFSYIKFNLNYGSALQCYALQQYLIKRGHEVSHVRDYRANPRHILKRLKYVKYPVLFFKKAKAQIALQGFIRRNIRLSERGYLSYRGLVNHCPEADCHIAGSDQIWHNANQFRYLTYVPDDKCKLSYAASFGKAKISDGMAQTIKPYLAGLDGISVREQSGVDIVKELGYEAEHLPDPTLLLDGGAYPAKKTGRSDYVYCYFLNLSQKRDIPFDEICDCAARMGKELLVTAPLNYPMFSEQNLLFPSVEEWLGLYQDAECIFTNTYHGLLFCIIFRKQFLFFAQKGGSVAENERFYSLLNMLNLTDRMVSGASEALFEKMNAPIDYEAVYQAIKEQRKKTDCFFERFGL